MLMTRALLEELLGSCSRHAEFMFLPMFGVGEGFKGWLPQPLHRLQGLGLGSSQVKLL